MVEPTNMWLIQLNIFLSVGGGGARRAFMAGRTARPNMTDQNTNAFFVIQNLITFGT